MRQDVSNQSPATPRVTRRSSKVGRTVRALAAPLLFAVASMGAAAPEPIQSPAALYGPLFAAVQTERVFPDGKTFADAVPKRDPRAIRAAYERRRPTGPALKAFVLENFVIRGENDRGDVRAHVRALWPQLVRPPLEAPAGGSALSLPASYVVPGGRFQEIYYWDSYFTMLGLKVDGQSQLIDDLLDNFTSLIERYGHIPNGTRSYYLSRSQPPYYALMLDLSDNRDPAVAKRRLAALRLEYDFWMKGSTCTGARGACLRVVRMPDGSLLNRYFDDKDTPRDESYAEDVAVAAKAKPRLPAEIFRDLRAGAESGWDFSSRWLRNPEALETIHTTDIVPVDLNSLMWAMERRIAKGCKAMGDRRCADAFTALAARRKAAIDRYLWVAGEKRYADWDLSTGRPSPVVSAAMLQPLFVGLSSRTQAAAVADTTRRVLLAPGGLRTTVTHTGQQWDLPNGWAPLQWVAIDGLAANGEPQLARTIAERWIETVTVAYAETGKMLEKYNVEARTPGGGGEYPVQDGFGWTNGVASAILARWPDIAAKDR